MSVAHKEGCEKDGIHLSGSNKKGGTSMVALNKPRRRNIFTEAMVFKGRHNPLRGGWDDEQLAVMADALGVKAPATAMVACSLIAEEATTAMPLRYSRSQKNYAYFQRFEGDELMTYRLVVSAADWLIANGYAEGHTGIWDLHRQSILRATPKLMALTHLVDQSRRQGAMLRDEIVLRDKDGHSIGFTDTDEIRQMRQQLKTINAFLANQRYFRDGVEMYVPPVARVFNQNFRRGGRLYHQGSSYQQMRKADRARIEMLLDDGTVTPMAELDFESLHMTLLYQRAGKRRPDGDLYALKGFSRSLAKVATLVAINADGTETGAISEILAGNPDLCEENGINHRSPSAIRAAVEKLIAAIKRKHWRIAEFFGSGAGAELMRTDSDMAVEIMLEMISRTGLCPLVVHDSFLVPVEYLPVLQEVMASALSHTHTHTHTQGNHTSSSPIPSSSSIHLGKHSLEQGEQKRVNSIQDSDCTLTPRTWSLSDLAAAPELLSPPPRASNPHQQSPDRAHRWHSSA